MYSAVGKSETYIFTTTRKRILVQVNSVTSWRRQANRPGSTCTSKQIRIDEARPACLCNDWEPRRHHRGWDWKGNAMLEKVLDKLILNGYRKKTRKKSLYCNNSFSTVHIQ